jgi:hypothetical protein
MIAIKQPLTNVQIELLKIYSTNISEPDLKELKDLIAKFYANKAIEYANKAWKEKNLTNETMDNWLNED